MGAAAVGVWRLCEPSGLLGAVSQLRPKLAIAGIRGAGQMKWWIMRMSRLVAVVAALCLLTGCSTRSTEPAGDAKQLQTADQSTARNARSQQRAQRKRNTRARFETYSARSGAAAGKQTALSAEDAVQRMAAIVQDSVHFAPTLVVWFFDISPSAMQWGNGIHNDIRQFYDEVVPQLIIRHPDRLESAVWTISRRVATPVQRSSDPNDVVRAIEGLRLEESGREVTFQAIQQALKEYLQLRVQRQREVLFVVVTDEAGDDWSLVDQLVYEPRKYALPVFVIGVPAPFGSLAALDATVETTGSTTESEGESSGMGGDWLPILQGPESRALERVQLRFGGYGEENELLDSGFGPFGLERLCRASGGSFLAVRRTSVNDFSFDSRRTVWPSAGLVAPDPEVMRRYLPSPIDGAAYEAQLNTNRARQALHQAALLPPAEVLRDPQLFFTKRSEANLKNLLDKAQQSAAKVAPAVDRLYELLREGAVDADQLTSPRWKAGFELAFGRVCAAKARIDGYNSMLAALKRGKSFENEESTTWVLQSTDSNDASSSLRKLIERAQMLLQGVVDQHPETPWATVAQQELANPMGWKWTEQR